MLLTMASKSSPVWTSSGGVGDWAKVVVGVVAVVDVVGSVAVVAGAAVVVEPPPSLLPPVQATTASSSTGAIRRTRTPPF